MKNKMKPELSSFGTLATTYFRAVYGLDEDGNGVYHTGNIYCRMEEEPNEAWDTETGEVSQWDDDQDVLAVYLTEQQKETLKTGLLEVECSPM